MGLVGEAGRGGGGDDVTQEGTGDDGRPIRWAFRDVTANSFEWTGHRSVDGGATWVLEQRMTGRRRTA